LKELETGLLRKLADA